MPKALWIALPIALFFGLAGALALLRRPLSRAALNALSSLLLLAYLAITAGLGVFWVANQQLPVFDLHYLFGYGTVVLVAVHLAFNLRLVLAFFRRAKKPSGAEARREPRREPRPTGAALRSSSGPIALAALGMLAAFGLGVRHGKVELRVDGRSAGSEPAPWADVAERYHALSSHSRWDVVARAPAVDWGDPPDAFKAYPGAPRVALPPPGDVAAPRSISLALRGPDRPRTSPLDLAAVSGILHHTAGVTRDRGGLLLRAAPSSGALFPAEIYVIARGPGLEAGLYHYDPRGHALVRLGDAPSSRAIGAPHAPEVERAPMVALVTSVLRRTGHKYRDRAYRYAAADTGHLLENLAVAAAEHGLFAAPLAAFDDRAASKALGLDGAEEAVLAVVPLALEAPAGREASGPAFVPLDVLPETPLGVTGTLHAATSLRWAPLKRPGDAPPPDAAIALAEPSPAPGTALSTIAARESRRSYAETPIALSDLGALLQHATAGPPRLSAAVTAHVVATRVGGLGPGAYRFLPEARALAPARAGDRHEEARAAALAQDVIGDAAAVVVLSIDRRAALAGGARGYRHAFLEVGMVGERILLEATARGLGACPVGAFYDDEAAALVAVDRAQEYVAHFVALGVKD